MGGGWGRTNVFSQVGTPASSTLPVMLSESVLPVVPNGLQAWTQHSETSCMYMSYFILACSTFRTK